MALMPRLRALLRKPFSASTVAARRPTSASRHGDTVQEDALRAMLIDDPNDSRAFDALAEVVRRRAAETAHIEDDPLTAPQDEESVSEARKRAADLAVWALAEELAGHPRGWYPLLELGRLSLESDPEGAVRRLATAAERDPEGKALAGGLEILRGAGMPVEALGLGVGHWRAREHAPEVGQHMVLAALEADRALEAKQHLANLDLHPDQGKVAAIKADLEHRIATHQSPNAAH